MPSNSNSTPSPKQRNRFISTLRRTLLPHPQLASPSTPPCSKPVSLPHLNPASNLSSFRNTDPGWALLFSQKNPFSLSLRSRDSHSSSPTSSGSSDLSTPSPSTRSTQPTPQQRRYAAIFSKITFSTAEFIEDRYVYSHSPVKPEGPMTVGGSEEETEPQGNLIPCPSFFAIPSSRQPSLDQSQMLTLPPQHRINWGEISGVPTPRPPLRSCFQEVFDLLDAGIADQSAGFLGQDDVSDHVEHDASSPSDLLRRGASSDLLKLPEVKFADAHPDLLGSSNESIYFAATDTSDNPTGNPSSPGSEPTQGNHSHSSEALQDPPTNITIHSFLCKLSASLRNDPTEFSPRISEWDGESRDFSWLHAADQLDPNEHNTTTNVTLYNPRSSAQLTHLSRFLKRSSVRVKNKPLKTSSHN
ncbi:hypothetical protein VP01_1288g1 [Puccinia sorghi]|uniref:Uncharacterized protein n=1 Tax=Puccinia sorghi TaxID=27349 RepID=A0A0L6VNK9_9BASI|nr:hypothetical protein VP01_1288g1 [Puccinia sorghi]